MSNAASGPSNSLTPDGNLPSHLVSALLHLRNACLFAARFDRELWQFAVELSTLEKLGANSTDCRWLICEGLVQHAHETSLAGEDQRTFRMAKGNGFTDRTCFILTEQGLAIAENTQSSIPDDASSSAAEVVSAPRWDDQRQELYFGNVLVKKFKLPAPNQKAILQAFQEEHWATRIDDPLPPKKGQDPKRRLHDTINSLNRNQKRPLIHFFGDGSGCGVCWEPAPEAKTVQKR